MKKGRRREGKKGRAGREGEVWREGGRKGEKEKEGEGRREGGREGRGKQWKETIVYHLLLDHDQNPLPPSSPCVA